MQTLALNIGGHLRCWERPVVMAILNATPDSFVPSTRLTDESMVLRAAERALSDGAEILDIGGYSTRPGAPEVSMEEEWQRVSMAATAISRTFPEATLSVDTFRAEVARRAVQDAGVHIVNDISGGALDPAMFDTVAALRVPYILMHMQGTPQTMQQHTDYANLMADILAYFAERIDTLQRKGVRDIIVDPGFGFAKTLEQNYELLARMHELQVLGKPLLAGLSRKSMLYRLLNTDQEHALNATTAANMVALSEGAAILRVHDVRAAVEAVAIYMNVHKYQS